MSKYKTTRVRYCPYGHDTLKTGRCYSGQCKICDREYKKKNRKRIKQLNRKSFIKQKYGLTVEQFENLKLKQDYKCAICKLERPLSIDHDHKTGLVRGLLCSKCNLTLGLIEDSIPALSSAIDYLRKTHVTSAV